MRAAVGAIPPGSTPPPRRRGRIRSILHQSRNSSSTAACGSFAGRRGRATRLAVSGPAASGAGCRRTRTACPRDRPGTLRHVLDRLHDLAGHPPPDRPPLVRAVRVRQQDEASPRRPRRLSRAARCADAAAGPGITRWTTRRSAGDLAALGLDAREREAGPAAPAAPALLEGAPVQERRHEGAIPACERRRPPPAGQIPQPVERTGQDEPRDRVQVDRRRLAAQPHRLQRNRPAPGKRIEHPRRPAALRFAAAADEFAVRDPPDDPDADGKLTLVTRLVREGILQPGGLSAARPAPPDR